MSEVRAVTCITSPCGAVQVSVEIRWALVTGAITSCVEESKPGLPTIAIAIEDALRQYRPPLVMGALEMAVDMLRRRDPSIGPQRARELVGVELDPRYSSHYPPRYTIKRVSPDADSEARS